MTSPRVRVVRVGAAGVTLLALSLGCGHAPDRRSFTVGTHRVSTLTPSTWNVYEHGREILIRSGDEQVAIVDLGPAGPAGIRRQVERARELWRKGQDRDARWRMRRVPVADDLFETVARREEFWRAWSAVSGAPENASAADMEEPFARLLEVIATLPPRTLEQITDGYLDEQDPHDQHDVALRRQAVIGGREALIVDTWDRVAHRMRRRYAFVLDDGDLIALRTDRGRFGENAQVLAVMIASFRVD